MIFGIVGSIIGVLEGDTGSLDYGSYIRTANSFPQPSPRRIKEVCLGS